MYLKVKIILCSLYIYIWDQDDRSWAASTSFTQDTRKAAGRATPDAGRDMLVPDSLVLLANLSLVNWTSGAYKAVLSNPLLGHLSRGNKNQEK